MSIRLEILSAGPAVSVQDLGRSGHIGVGLSRGGAMDRTAVLEATALLGAQKMLPSIEMAASGGKFVADAPTRFALTGAEMVATLEGQRLAWNASHLLVPGETLTIGGTTKGVYGYITFAGGIIGQDWLGSKSAHFAAGVGGRLTGGEHLLLGTDPDPMAHAQVIEPADRFDGGLVRIMPSSQSDLFTREDIARFVSRGYRKGAQSNRQAVRVETEGSPVATDQAAGLVSDFVGPGDIQITGDGIPFVLMAECQTMGGYPRIATVLPDDLPVVAQAQAGAELKFEMLSMEDADRLYRSDAERLRDLRSAVRPMVRNPADISDLLSYQLISGVTSGADDGGKT